MEFDVIVGNPPYKRNLHLQFLEKCNSLLEKSGKIVWIHPARWLQDPLAPWKKGSDFLKYKDLPFQDFKIIPQSEAVKIFNNTMNSDLSISYLEKDKPSILNEEKIYELLGVPKSFSRIFKKIKKSLKDVSEENKRNGIRVRTKTIINSGNNVSPTSLTPYLLYRNPEKEIIIDGLIDGIDWVKTIKPDPTKKKPGSPIPLSIPFKTVNEAKNFINSTNTEFYLFLNYLIKTDTHVQIKFLPFMEDYTNPWTNERFQKFFEITDSEMEFIKETMSKFKK